MKSSFISTMSWTTSAMGSVNKLQSDISKKGVELSTGRHADIGLTLGVRTSLSVDLRREHSQLQGMLDSNVLIQATMTRTQTALSAVLTSASSYQETLLASQASKQTSAQMQMEGKAGLDALVAAMNTSDGARYVFGGINSGETPMENFGAGVNAAFQTYLTTVVGKTPETISAAEMQTFLTGLAAQFDDDTYWTDNWSNASGDPMSKQISLTERVDISTSANDPAIRKLAMAYTMMGYLDVTSMNDAALQVVMDTSRAALSEGMTGVTAQAAAIGVSQNRTTKATENLNITMDVVKQRITSLEEVDPAEAKTMLDTLTNQLQMSYATTTKIMSLSIMNYV
ncbi:flagellar hook-associated family protein [Xanthobacteraceae bacterium A53D]